MTSRSRGRPPTTEEVEDWLRFTKAPARPASNAESRENPEPDGAAAGPDAKPGGGRKAAGRSLDRSEEQDWADFVEGRPLGSGDAGKESAGPDEPASIPVSAVAGRQRTPRTSSGSGIDRKLARRLNAGRVDPERIIDLHGLDRGQAERNLKRFLTECLAARVRLALVISGKGIRSREDETFRETGVLRKSVPIWLGRQPLSDMVQHFQSAHAAHGGSGAFYVYLRRERKRSADS